MEGVLVHEDWHRSPSGLYVPFEPKAPKPRPVAIDLFAGCGGFSLGVIKAGFDVVAALEWDPAAIQTYLVNLGAYPVKMVFSDGEARDRLERYLRKQFDRTMKNRGGDFTVEAVYRAGGLMSGSNRHFAATGFAGVRVMFVGDARKFTGEQILREIGMDRGEVDLVVGGPPCQGFTTANSKRTPMDPRNSLVFEFARLVLEIQPRAMVMENVPGILNMVTPEGIPVVDALTKVLADGGFGAYDALRKSLLSTAGCGAALRREKKDKPKPANGKQEKREEPDQGSLFKEGRP